MSLGLHCQLLLPASLLLPQYLLVLRADPLKLLIGLLPFMLVLLQVVFGQLLDDLLGLEASLHVLREDLLHLLLLLPLVLLLLLSQLLSELLGLFELRPRGLNNGHQVASLLDLVVEEVEVQGGLRVPLRVVKGNELAALIVLLSPIVLVLLLA